MENEIENVIGTITNRVETHMSVIYMSDALVAKEIKPVDLGFVDLRSFEVRKAAAEKTAEIDRAYCPDLKSRVVLINGTPLIVMRRFDSSQGLDLLYDEGRVKTEYGKQIGRMFAAAHKRAKTSTLISEIAYQSISRNWEELFFVTKEVARAVGRTISEDDFHEVIEEIRFFVLDNDPYFQERRDKGVMRQCHGDGHAGNMFVEEGYVKTFDGIGFKDEFSYMDPVSDLAFAIMDAIARGRTDIAEAIKSSYSEDKEGVERLLNFYVCYRAFVRGQISTMIAESIEEGEEKEGMLNTARKYYNLAVEYLPRRR